MKKNFIYIHLAKSRDGADNFERYELYYQLVLENGYYPKKLLGIPQGNIFDPNDDHIIISVEISTDQPAEELENPIKINGIPERPKGHPQKITLKLDFSDGIIGGDGSTMHMGDAD